MPPLRRNFSGGCSPELIWLRYFTLWGVLVVGENAGKHVLRWGNCAWIAVQGISTSPRGLPSPTVQLIFVHHMQGCGCGSADGAGTPPDVDRG